MAMREALTHPYRHPNPFVRWTARVATASLTLGAGAAVDQLALHHTPAAEVRVVDGTVSCPSGEQVEGVWVDTANGTSGFARWRALGVSTVARYAYQITMSPGLPPDRQPDFSVTVGCGGTRENWEHSIGSIYVTGSHRSFDCTQGNVCQPTPDSLSPLPPDSTPSTRASS